MPELTPSSFIVGGSCITNVTHHIWWKCNVFNKIPNKYSPTYLTNPYIKLYHQKDGLIRHPNTDKYWTSEEKHNGSNYYYLQVFYDSNPKSGKFGVFKAIVYGEPTPNVTWNRANGKIDDPAKFQSKYDEASGEHTLEVSMFITIQHQLVLILNNKGDILSISVPSNAAQSLDFYMSPPFYSTLYISTL